MKAEAAKLEETHKTVEKEHWDEKPMRREKKGVKNDDA